MSLQHLTLGERIVMASRVAAAEHLRQDADSAGVSVRRLQEKLEIARQKRPAQATIGSVIADSFRQDLFRQPVMRDADDVTSPIGGDDRRAA